MKKITAIFIILSAVLCIVRDVYLMIYSSFNYSQYWEAIEFFNWGLDNILSFFFFISIIAFCATFLSKKTE